MWRPPSSSIPKPGIPAALPLSTLISAKIGSDEPLFDPPLHSSTLLFPCTTPIQSPFSGQPAVNYASKVPTVSILLQKEEIWSEDSEYTLELVDLTVAGFPRTGIKGLYRRYGDHWVRNKAGNREIALSDAIKDYESVQRHTVRGVLRARGRKRRLLEMLFYFGPKDTLSQMQIAAEMERFRSFLKTRDGFSSVRGRDFRVKTRLKEPKVEEYLPRLETMKTVTPRRLQKYSPSPVKELNLPLISPLRSRAEQEQPLTRSMLLSSPERHHFKEQQFPLSKSLAAITRGPMILIAGQSPVYSKHCKE